ncbi:winged helix-turn-helix transcriptional regulator, partial [uncultured Prevotella sp.]
TRERFEEVPPRVEYSLTPIAKDFLREISYVIEWGQLHFEQIVKGRK